MFTNFWGICWFCIVMLPSLWRDTKSRSLLKGKSVCLFRCGDTEHKVRSPTFPGSKIFFRKIPLKTHTNNFLSSNFSLQSWDNNIPIPPPPKEEWKKRQQRIQKNMDENTNSIFSLCLKMYVSLLFLPFENAFCVFCTLHKKDGSNMIFCNLSILFVCN